MAFVRSLLFAIVFYPATVLCVLSAFPASLFGSGALHAVTHAWVGIHRWCARICSASDPREGTIPPARAGRGQASIDVETMELCCA